MPRRAIPAEQKQNRKAEKAEADRVRRISQLEENAARLREKYKNNPYVKVAGDRTTRPNVASDLHSRASNQYQSMQKPERHTERAHVAQQVGDTRAVSISSTTPGASTPATQFPPPPPAPSQLLVSRTTEKTVRDPVAEDVEECRTPSNQSNMLYPAVSVDQTGKPSVEDTRAHRERILRELMAQEAKERERNPINNNAVKNLQSSGQVDAVASQLSLQQQTSSALEAPIISGAVTSRLTTDLTFRPRPQIEQAQQERHSKSPTKVPPALAVEHAEAVNPIAAPATSEVGRINRPCNSGRRLQDTLERATRLEADRAQLRRERELDQLLRASKTRTKSNQVKDSSQQPSIRRQDASQKSHLATRRTGAHTAANNATRSELRVELPVRRVQENNETMEDVIAVTANRPRQATAVTISSTSSRETTSTTATELAEFLPPRPPQSPPPVWKATDAYSPSSASQSEEGSNRRSGNASEVTETPSPSLPTEARPQTPSSMDKDEDEDEESLASPSWKLPQHHHISPSSGFHESRTTSRDRAKIRVREPSILDIEALNIRDKSSLASTTSKESVRDRSPIPAGENDSDYRPSSPIPVADEESEASTIGAFGPDSGPATPASSRHTSNLFSPSEPSISHMSMLSSPGMYSATSPAQSDGNSTPTGRPRPGESHRVLDRYLGAIFDQETRGGADFLAKQGKVYRQVIRTFFDIKCDCPHPHEQDEPEQTHSLRERVAYLQRSLPPLSEVFGENGSYDPRSYFHLWQKILSDQPAEPLSFRKSQMLLPQSLNTISRFFDIDSIWFAGLTLGAIRAPNDFRLTFLPRFSLHISTDQVVQPHGLDLAKTRHVLLGYFQTGSTCFSVFVFFPSSASSPHSKTSASSNTLSHERLRDFYDEIILPAIREASTDPFCQEIPQSFDMAYAQSRSPQEKPATSRHSPDDENRYSQMSYTIPAKHLSLFWSLVRDKAKLFRIPTKRGENVAYYDNPLLVFQAHDLKNTFARQSIHETLCHFSDTVLAGLNPDQLDMRSCYIDIGARYFADGLVGRQRRVSEPTTLLWKSQCNRHLHKRMVDIAPDSPLSATYYRSFLLRDTGNLMSKATVTRAPNAGHPDCQKAGIIRAKLYNSNKAIFGVKVNRNYGLYSSPALPLAALSQDMIRDLDSRSKRDRVFNTRHSRESITSAGQANKRHIRAICTPNTVRNYGARKEVTFCLSTILKEWKEGNFNPDRNPHTGPLSQVALAESGSEYHYSFWTVPTNDINDLVFTQAARLILPLDHLFHEASLSSTDETGLCNTAESFVRRIFALYTAQLLCGLLVYNFSSEREYNFDKWIWYPKWRVQKSKREVVERRGLGLEQPILASGMLWIPRELIDWRRGHLALATLLDLYIPRSPLQTRLTSQKNIQGLSTTQLTVEYIVQEWVQEASQAYNEHRHKRGNEIANRIARLCAEETARAYNQHLLAKIQAYWDRVRSNVGRHSLPALSRLQQAQEDVGAERSRIVTAQTIWEIYNEAWDAYAVVVPNDTNLRMPLELPCWMTTRKYLPPKDGWSEFVHRHLFRRSRKPKWNGIYFLQVFRTFEKFWNPIKEHAGRFDDRMKSVLGRSIMVTFNSNQAKEVGTSHTIGTWYHGKPTFFQMQYWAPYFSPPQDNRDMRLESMPSVIPQVLTAAHFQDLERAVHQDWLCVMDRTDDLLSTGKETVNSRCRRALRHMTLLAGPIWGSSQQLDHIVPWKLGTTDAFRVPLWHVIVARSGSSCLLSEPTVLLPTREKVMSLFKMIKTFPGLTDGLKQRLRWAKSRLHNEGMPYDIHSHLEAKNEAAKLTSQSPSLLRQFLAQTEPPERRVFVEEADEAERESELFVIVSDESESELEPESESDGESAELSDELPGDVW